VGELARHITERLDCPVVVFWGPGGEVTPGWFTTWPTSEIAPATTYLEMGKLLTFCRALVSAETGALHLSVAVGTPTVCLIVLPTRAQRPLDERSRIVLPPPPMNWDYRRKGDNPTALIQVLDIIDAVSHFWTIPA
jgi:ADP-heptose:LPS heptosyltransferase